MCSSIYASLVALAFVASPGHAQLYEWVSPVDGDWHLASNWSLGFVPDNGSSDVLLGHVLPYTVTVDMPTLVRDITIQHPDATLLINGAELDLIGDILSNGTLRLESGTIDIILDRRFDGNGLVELGAISDPMFATIDALNASLINGPGHTISGSGRIQGTFHNDGDVIADDPIGPGLELDHTITQGTNGRIGADGGELLLQSGVSINGGELFTTNGGVIRVEGPYILTGIDATISAVQINGRIDVLDSYNRLHVDGSIQNNGEIVINSELDADEPELRITSDASILGNGEIVLHSDSSSAAYMTTESGITGTIGQNMTVRGAGIIDGNGNGGVGGFVNNGSIIADDPDYLLVLLGDHTGPGLFGAASGSGLGLGQFADMVDCHFNTLGDGYIAVYYALVNLIGGTNDGFIYISGDGQLRISGNFVNNGLIQTDPDDSFTMDLLFSDQTVIEGVGEININNPFGGFDALSSSAHVTIGAGQRLTGEAEFYGIYTVHGGLFPQSDFEILHEMTLTSTSKVDMLVGHASSFDDSEISVDIDALLNLSGELEVQFVETYTPIAGDSFRLITGIPGVEIVGAFDTITLPPSPNGLMFEINEESFGIYLDVVEDINLCLADLTGEGDLNFLDVSAFLSAYGSMDPVADFEADGMFNFLDVSTFLAAFAAGCP
jgi:hypothetical protein